ncbi:MAG TPA: DUF503 domain-containing protein [Longimicrobiales bacterium]|nr:DUF503 domain-containing protein [Longimicrobiales bacterium]
MAVVGVIVWQLEIIGSQSLKEKRSVVKSLKERLQSRFRVSAAETNYQDVWQRAELAAAVVSGDQHHVSEVLDATDRLVLNDMRVRVISVQRSYH